MQLQPKLISACAILFLLTFHNKTLAQLPDASKIELNVFPNPNKGTFYITLISEKAYYAKLFSMDGKRVKTLYLENGLNYISIDIPTGLYILKLDEADENQVFKINIK